MLVVRSSLALLVSALLLSSCATAEFPEQEINNEAQIDEAAIKESEDTAIGADDGVVIIASAAKEEEAASKASEDENIVIIASASKPDQAIKSDETRVKTKPILKSKTKRNLTKAKYAKDNKSADTDKLISDKQSMRIVKTETTSTLVVEEKEEVKFAEEAPAVAEPSVTYQIDTFYFDDGSSSIKNEDKAKIKKIAKLAKDKKATLYVLGYSSSRTNDTDYVTHKMANFKVSLARAETVADAFIKAGVPDDKVLLEALSDGRPAFLEVMPEGERLNRRVEVYIGY